MFPKTQQIQFQPAIRALDYKRQPLCQKKKKKERKRKRKNSFFSNRKGGGREEVRLATRRNTATYWLTKLKDT